MAASVGIRELRDRLSAILRRVRDGEPITVTDRNRPVALVLPIGDTGRESLLRRLAALGVVSWSGGKPKGASSPPTLQGPDVAAAVLEDRR